MRTDREGKTTSTKNALVPPCGNTQTMGIEDISAKGRWESEWKIVAR